MGDARRMNITAHVEVDQQHGPIVRVIVDGTITSVYLLDETGVVTTIDDKQCGIEVNGPWSVFKNCIKQIL